MMAAREEEGRIRTEEDAGGEGRSCLLAASSLFFPPACSLSGHSFLDFAGAQTRAQIFSGSDSVTLRYTELRLTLGLTRTQTLSYSDSRLWCACD